MKTKVEVKKDGTDATDVHEVDGEPDVVSHLVNRAVKKEQKLVTLKIPGDKKLSVIAENVTAIWQE